MAGLICLAVYELGGLGLSLGLFTRRGRMTRVWLGLTLGLVMLMWLPSLFAFSFGFTMKAQYSGLITAAGAGVLGLLVRLLFRRGPSELRSEQPPLSAVLWGALPVFLVMAYMLWTHTLRPEDGALYTGQSTYGDMNLHLGIVTGLADASYPPEYTLLPGTLLGYPFLADAASATLYMFGLPLRWAYMLPALLMSALVPWGFVMTAWETTRSKRVVLLACALMFLNGGLGFAYSFDLFGRDPSRFFDIFTGFYKTPTNLVDVNVRWVNVLADMMLPQRTLLAGWTMLIPALWLVQRAVREKSLGLFAVLGVWAGAMPMVHTHSFLALGLISAGAMTCTLIWCRREARGKLFSGFVVYGALAVLMALPQLLTWTFPQTVGGGSLRFRFNWSNNQNGLIDEYFWFWLKNVGPVFLVMIPAARYAKRRQQMLAMGALVVFIVAELIQFQPNEYDNNKLFYAAFIVMTPIAAQYLCALYDRLAGLPGRRLLAVVFVGVSVISGALSVAREVVSDFRLYGPAEVRAAEYIDENTERGSVFLTGDQHVNAVSTLTGRSIVCGSATFLYFHGVDFSEQAASVRLMFEAPEENLDLFERYNVSYIYVSSYERMNYDVDEEAIAARWPLVWDEDGVRIYDARPSDAAGEADVEPSDPAEEAGAAPPPLPSGGPITATQPPAGLMPGDAQSETEPEIEPEAEPTAETEPEIEPNESETPGEETPDAEEIGE